MSERSTYRFGPLERRGLVGGIRGGQAALIAGAGGGGLVLVGSAPSMGAALGGVLIALGGIGVAALPVARRTLDEWAPIAALWASRRTTGEHRYRSPAPSAGNLAPTPHIPGKLRRRRTREPAAELPPALAGVEIVAIPYHGRTVGAVSERGGRWLSAVLACRVGSPFALLDVAGQDERLGGWGRLLAATADTAVRRVQWLERTAPAEGDELARWLERQRDPTVPLRGSVMMESYLELINASTAVAQEHEVFVAVQIDIRRARGGGVDGPALLIEETRRVAGDLRDAQVLVDGALSERQLAGAIRNGFDPYGRGELAALAAADPTREGVAAEDAGPLGAREAWGHYRSDGALHATYWIAAWPRVDVGSMFLDALLGASGAVRTVAVTIEPVATDRSTRAVESAVTQDEADRDLRRRWGQVETARQRQGYDATRRREAELAAGHREVRLAGFVTVSGRDENELRQACHEVVRGAQHARLELRLLYGQQADAFTFTLPGLARGLR